MLGSRRGRTERARREKTGPAPAPPLRLCDKYLVLMPSCDNHAPPLLSYDKHLMLMLSFDSPMPPLSRRRRSLAQQKPAGNNPAGFLFLFLRQWFPVSQRLVFELRRHTAAQMALGPVPVQHRAHFRVEHRVEFSQPLADVLMYRAF